VGNCVGKRNNKYFLAFINFTSLLIAYLMACSLWNLAIMANNNQDADPIVRLNLDLS
jgi:hypothetical protein